MQKDPQFKKEYTQFMRDYEELGHMTKINEEAESTHVEYYMPHHGVIQRSTTTKLRFVFDA